MPKKWYLKKILTSIKVAINQLIQNRLHTDPMLVLL